MIFGGFQVWFVQQTNILVALTESSEIFCEAAPHLGLSFAKDLKEFEDNFIVNHLFC
jgi:hypothetical protein